MTTLADQSRDMARIADWLARDRNDEITPDAEGRRRLAKQGWELKAGVLHAPTSLGTTVAMFPEAVLFGETEGAREVPYFIKTRAAMQPEYKAAFKRFIFNVARFRSENVAYRQLEPYEQKALTEGQDDAGGYLVPADATAEILSRVAARAVVRPRATVILTGRDTLRIPRVQPAAATAGGLSSGGGSIFASGFVGSWAGETPAFSDTDPAFGLFNVSIKKIRCVTKLGTDFVADSDTDVLAFLARGGGDNLALVEDQGFLVGDGAALQPHGLLNSGIATVDLEGSTVNTISNTTAAAGSAPKLRTLCYGLPSQYAAQASWITRRTVEGSIRALVDNSNRPLFEEEEEGTLLQKPIANSDFMPADGTDQNKVALFGDLSGYIVAQRTQISVRVLRERFRDVDQLGFILSERVGGALYNEDALRIGVV